MMRRFLLLGFLVCLLSTEAVGQQSIMVDSLFISDAQDAIRQAYNREFGSSIETLMTWRQEHPESPVWALWPVFNVWWPIIADLTDTQYDKAFTDVVQNAIGYASSLESDHPYYLDALIVLSISHAYWGRLQSNRNQWLRSFRNARRALSYLSEIEKLAPEHPDIPFAEGMTLYFSAFLLDEYPAARPFSFILPKGDREKGLEIIEGVAEDGVFFSVESKYFLGHIYLHYERNPNRALPFIEALYEVHPDNPYYARLMARTYFRLRRYGEAQSIIRNHISRYENVENPAIEVRALREEFYLLQGRILQIDQQFAQSIHFFERAKQESRKMHASGQRTFEIMAYFHQGQVHQSRGELLEARQQFEWVVETGASSPYVRLSQNTLQSLKNEK